MIIEQRPERDTEFKRYGKLYVADFEKYSILAMHGYYKEKCIGLSKYKIC